MLIVNERIGRGKEYNHKLKAKKLIPGVVYGANMESPLMVEFSPNDFVKAIRTPKKYNTIVELEVTLADGKKETKKAILKELQKHPFRDEIHHVDFFVYDNDTPQVFKVPFRPEGRSVGVVAGGKLKVAMKKIKVLANPEQVPVELTHNITKLERGGVVRISDLVYPEGVKPLYDARQALVSVTAIKLGPNGKEQVKDDLLDGLE
jgi:large subunit ribosomal protein L25